NKGVTLKLQSLPMRYINISRLGPFAFVLLFSFQGSFHLKQVHGKSRSATEHKYGDEVFNINSPAIPVNG
ncbi:MAG: hypothetical protein K9K37_10095, partial [Desulfocapsa sp.]|nr:hypothetical protein [Desulfocapsa sp.]